MAYGNLNELLIGMIVMAQWKTTNKKLENCHRMAPCRAAQPC